MSAIEATRGDQSSGYHFYSLTAFWCPLAAESRVRRHHRFVRSSPDSGGGFSDSPLDSQSMGSAIFYALDSGRGLCHPGRSPCMCVCVCIHVYEHVQCSTYSFVVHFQFRIAVSLLAVFALMLMCSNGFLDW